MQGDLWTRFAHASELRDGDGSVRDGDRVTFRNEYDDRRQKSPRKGRVRNSGVRNEFDDPKPKRLTLRKP